MPWLVPPPVATWIATALGETCSAIVAQSTASSPGTEAGWAGAEEPGASWAVLVPGSTSWS